MMNGIDKLSLKIVLLSIMVFMALHLAVFAQEEEKINVIIDNVKIEFDVEPLTIEGRTMVPFRKIFEVFHFKVDWSEATNTVFANKGSKTIILQIDNKRAFVNSAVMTLDVPAQLIHDRTMVPLRFVAENIGANVVWIEATSTVNITTLPPSD